MGNLIYILNIFRIYYFITVPPKISPFFANRDLHLGERTSLTCSVTRGDQPIRITWLKDGRALGPSERVSITNVDQYNSMLMIESLSPDHNGNISCLVANNAGSTSYSATLVVHGNPSSRSREKNEKKKKINHKTNDEYIAFDFFLYFSKKDLLLPDRPIFILLLYNYINIITLFEWVRYACACFYAS